MSHSKMLATRRRNKKNMKLRARIAKAARKLERQKQKSAAVSAAKSSAS